MRTAKKLNDKSLKMRKRSGVLQFAISEARAVLTLNRKHFFRLHREHPAHAGIVACTYDADFAAQALRIDAALKAAIPVEGQLVRVNRPR